VAAAAATEGLSQRRRRQALGKMRAAHATALAEIPSRAQVAQDAMIALLLARSAAEPRAVATPITDRVHERLAPGDIEDVTSRLAGDPAVLYATCDEETRRRIVLNFAAAYAVAPVLERAGMSASMPPPDVHAMARGEVAAGGDFALADLVFDALDHAGIDVGDNSTVLDFGSSSGRTLRAIAAGRPDLESLGCDPNDGAIAWAATHLPMATFFVSPLRPPLALPDASVQLAYAISVWSHFAEAPATAWLKEMHRILAPGAALVLTTHGIDCLSTQLRRGDISDETAAAAAAGLLETGHHFVDVFGPDGDWGVKDEGWGNAWFSLEWLLSHTGDDWAVLLDWPGALDQVQDVVVLQRR
jgi:SAM-dependent methyltransferase